LPLPFCRAEFFVAVQECDATNANSISKAGHTKKKDGRKAGFASKKDSI